MDRLEETALAVADAYEKMTGPDPSTLIDEARPANNLMGADVIDDSFTRNGANLSGKYFVARRYAAYIANRARINPSLDHGPATPDVELVLRQRHELAAAMTAWRRAPGTIAPADQRDLDEAAAARREDREVPAPHHGPQARAAADVADMTAAFALIDAEEGERALAESLRRHAFAIYEARQASITARRRRYLDLIAQAGEEAEAIRVEEDDLGLFGVDVLVKLINPATELAAQLAGTEGMAKRNGPHPVTVGEVLAGTGEQAHGRQLPRGPGADLKRAALWGRSDPWAAAWGYTATGPEPRTVDQAPAPAPAPAPPRRRGRPPKPTTAA